MNSFTSRVLPSSGWYVLTVGTPKGDGESWYRNYRYETIEELETAARNFDVPPKTVYYALAAFDGNEDSETGKITRKAVQTRQFRTLAFDVDVGEGKPYATQQAAATAVLMACSTLDLPEPCLVSSGYGLHCYYPLTMDVSTRQWRTVSEALRDLLLANGVDIDTSKICEPAMVLRPVGTQNRKQGVERPVRLVQDTGDFDPYVLFERILKLAKREPAPAGAAKRVSAVADAVMSVEYPPAKSEDIEAKCPQITAIAACGGNVEEPLWYAALGIAGFCVDSDAVALRWSRGHPKFDAVKTLQKMEQWKVNSGPSSCAHFERINSAPCASCPHRGRVGSPIQLSDYQPAADTPAAVAAKAIPMPHGYLVRGSMIFKTVGDEVIPVSEYLLYPSRRYKDDHSGKSMCLVEVNFPKAGWGTVPLEMDTLGGSTKDFHTWALNHQLFIANELMLKMTRTYLMTYLQELQRETDSEVLCNSFGWLDDTCESFVLGERLIKKSVTETVRLGGTAATFGATYSPKGDLQKWVQATSIFNAPGLEFHGLVFLMGVGAPLMVGSNLKSVLVNMYSAASGTGKSTTGSFINSAYGNPEKTRLTVEDTQNATFKTMGVYGNLPIYIDEITTIDPRLLPKTVYFLTQGREKKRLTKGGGFQESMEWETVSIASSNQDLYALLAERFSTDGETMRILQFEVGPNAVFAETSGGTNAGYQLNKFLDRNHGLIGEPFIKAILELGGPHVVFEAALKKFHRTFNFDFTGKERFWQAAMVIAYATGEICRASGLTDFNHEQCVREGLRYIVQLRKETDSTKLDCFEILGQYVGEHQSKVVFWKHNRKEDRSHYVDPVPTHECVARMEIEYDKTNPFKGGRLYINQVQFNKWCRDRGADVRGLVAQLAANGVTVHKDRRLSLMRGTPVTMPAVRSYEIVMKHERFVEVMQQNAVGAGPTELKVVAG